MMNTCRTSDVMRRWQTTISATYFDCSRRWLYSLINKTVDLNLYYDVSI
jgi:hypothetical protein